MKFIKKNWFEFTLLSVVIIFILFTIIIFASHLLNNYNDSIFRSYMEAVYFLCSPLVLIISIVALYQIKISLKTLDDYEKSIDTNLKSIEVNSEAIEVNSKREAFRLAAEQCETYNTDIMESEDEFVTELKELELVLHPNGSKYNKKILELFFSSDSNLFKLFAIYVNKLEAFSSYFISGVADEKIAFAMVGIIFCEAYERYISYIEIQAENSQFTNLKKLYDVWVTRLRKQRTEKQISDMQTKLENLKEKEISHIGY